MRTGLHEANASGGASVCWPWSRNETPVGCDRDPSPDERYFLAEGERHLRKEFGNFLMRQKF
jgi:hypothetical protein